MSDTKQSFLISQYRPEFDNAPKKYWWKEVLGHKVKFNTGIKEFELFVHEDGWGAWHVSDVYSGNGVSRNSAEHWSRKDAVDDAKRRIRLAIKAGTLQEVFDKTINSLRGYGLLDDQNNKIGEKVMVEREASDDDTEL